MQDFLIRVATEYCERTGNTFLSEPLNFISNLTFFISAFFVYKLFQQHKVKETYYWFLLALLVFIGIGSSLWHSIRHPYALVLDVLPIFVFFLSLLFLLFNKLLRSSYKALVLLLIFFFMQVGASYLFPDFLNGSIRHVINGSVFIAITAVFYRRNKVIRSDSFKALSFYILATVCRSIDNLVCPFFPIGTHFLWHTFNAVAAYFAIRMLLYIRPKPPW